MSEAKLLPRPRSPTTRRGDCKPYLFSLTLKMTVAMWGRPAAYKVSEIGSGDVSRSAETEVTLALASARKNQS